MYIFLLSASSKVEKQNHHYFSLSILVGFLIHRCDYSRAQEIYQQAHSRAQSFNGLAWHALEIGNLQYICMYVCIHEFFTNYDF